MKAHTLLFDETTLTKSLKDSPRWLLVTNQLNLMFMLASGLILPPKGFGGKYYKDALADFPGWIPLFADSLPRQVFHAAISEEDYLKPCAAEVNLTALTGRVMAVRRDGSASECAFPEELQGDEAVLLIPAPLPTAWVESIVFRSKEDKSDCERDARDYANVPLSDFKLEVASPLFARASEFVWPPAGLALADRDDSLDIVMASGGMIAMMFQMGNLGEIGMPACRVAFDHEEAIAAAIPDPMIRAMYDWLKTGKTPSSGEVSLKLFWGVIERVARCRSNREAVPQDAVLDFLDASQKSMEERLRTALARLTDDLRAVSGFADTTITELFQRHPRPLSRVLTLFFLRDKCSALVEFKHPLLTETDYIAAALLFAARDSWLGLSPSLREPPGLNAAVSHRMAAMAHRISGSGLELGAPPRRCMPLRELFSPKDKVWSAKQKAAAIHLARESKWNCLHTKISLGKGDYRLVIDSVGTHILLPGEVKAVIVEPDMAEFFRKLSETRIAGKLDVKVREIVKA